MLQKLWYDRPVRTQLLIAVGAINLLAALVAGAVSIFNTRTATQVEMEASLDVAKRFVDSGTALLIPTMRASVEVLRVSDSRTATTS